MTDFKPLTLEDRDLLLRYLKPYRFNTYEYSFLTLYLWKNYCNVEYGMVHDALVIKKREADRGSYFMQPIGYTQDSLPAIMKELMVISQGDPSFRYLLGDVEEPFFNQLQEIYGPDLPFAEDINNFDYIYDTQKLIHLTGRKLHNKKNHYNQFINQYSYELRDLRSPSVIGDCLGLSELWLKTQKLDHRELLFELEGIANVLNHQDYLNAIGMAVYVDHQIAGFTIGEKVSQEMAIIHVEKGDINYKGIYAFINKAFAEHYLEDVTTINREEDLGIAGLRKTKLAYDPLKLEKKYFVDIAR